MNDFDHRVALIQLILRRENLELQEVLQTMAERQLKLVEAERELETAQATYSVAAAHDRLIKGQVLDLAIQTVTKRSLVDQYHRVQHTRQAVERLTTSVDSLRSNIAERRTRLRKLERAEQQAALGVARNVASIEAKEFDAIWLGGHLGGARLP